MMNGERGGQARVLTTQPCPHSGNHSTLSTLSPNTLGLRCLGQHTFGGGFCLIQGVI